MISYLTEDEEPLFERLAKLVVNDTLRIDSSDIVSITTWPHTIDAANAISKECFKQGADVLLNLWTDDYYYSLLEELSEKSLREPSKVCQAFTETVTAQVNLSGPENPEFLKKISSSKFTAWFEGERKAHFPRSLERKIRSANLLLGLVTPQRAKTYGFKFGTWKNVMEDAITADLKKISKVGRELSSILEQGHKVQITAANGTGLTLELVGRPVHIDDGMIDENDIARKSLDAQLPAGFIETTVVETGGDGKVIFDLPIQTLGVNVEGLEWDFEKGKITSMTAKKNLEPLSDTLGKASGDKDRIALLGIGLNPKAEYGYMMNNIVEGAVAIGVGDNEAIGGKNKSSYGIIGELSKATLEIDGKPIIGNGKLQLE